jgi:hypothetical protein
MPTPWSLDYSRWVVLQRVLIRSLRLWLTRHAEGTHISAPPWRWWSASHPVGWAVRTHDARHAEIGTLFARRELAHTRRVRFTKPRQAAAWLATVHG